MPMRRYEVRVAGRLSSRARDAFVGMGVTAAPPETVIAGTLDDDEDLHRLLALIQSLGLSVVSVEQVAADAPPQAADSRRRACTARRAALISNPSDGSSRSHRRQKSVPSTVPRGASAGL